MIDAEPDEPINQSEQRRDAIILRATKQQLLVDRLPGLSLEIKNDALRFFAAQAKWLPEITPAVLIGIAKLRRDRPHDWQDRARAYFMDYPRRMAPTWLDTTIRPERVTRPAWVDKVYTGEFEKIAGVLDDHSVDLVVTSPPYAMQRRNDYGGVEAAQYPEFTVTWMREVRRLLKSTGSVIIVIRPHIFNGELNDYMLRTRLALRADGWVELEEFIWDKPDAPPLGHVGRPRRAWESVHWFAATNDPYIQVKAAGTRSQRLGFINNKGAGRYVHHKVSGAVTAGVARPRDVLRVPAGGGADRSSANTHSAQFPVALVEPIVQMLCPRFGLVCDPFLGSGTTAIAAIKTGRHYVGFEKIPHYADAAQRRIAEFRLTRKTRPTKTNSQHQPAQHQPTGSIANSAVRDKV